MSTPSTDGAPDPEERGELWDDLTKALQVRNVVLRIAAEHVNPGPDGQDYIDRRELIEAWLTEAYEEVGRDGRIATEIDDLRERAARLDWREIQVADLTEQLTARVVPEDRPAQCPNCGSTDPRKVGIRPASPLTGDGAYSVAFSEVCSDPWHDEPAGVPALDDDTRREVERIVEHLRHDVDVIDQGAYEDMAQVSRSIDRAAELLVAAYLGGTER